MRRDSRQKLSQKCMREIVALGIMKVIEDNAELLNTTGEETPPEETTECPKEVEIKKSPKKETPWWQLPTRYEAFRKHTRCNILSKYEKLPRSKRKKIGPLSSSSTDEDFIRVARSLINKPKSKPTRDEALKLKIYDAGRNFAVQLASIVDPTRSIEEIDDVPGKLSVFGAVVEKKLGLIR